MWTELPIPKIKSKIRACSVPNENHSLVIWTTNKIYHFQLDPTFDSTQVLSVHEITNQFHEKYGVYFSSDGFPYAMHGDCGRFGKWAISDLLTEHPHGFSVERDEQRNQLRLVDAAGIVHMTVDDFDVRDELQIANFSKGVSRHVASRYFVVCTSTMLRVFVYQPTSGGAPSKWSATGSWESRQPIWNAVIDNPDDDAPRLIYADWLEEHGDVERAEFIRLQCRIAQREQWEFLPSDDPDRIQNWQYEKKHGDRWMSEGGSHANVESIIPFWRGFPCCSINTWKFESLNDQIQAIMQSNPMESISLYDFRDTDTEKIIRWNHTSKWRNLIINTVRNDAILNFALLLKSPRLSELRKITFVGNYGQELNQALVSNGPFPHLHTIRFEVIAPDMPDLDYSILANPEKLPRLRNVLFYVNGDVRLKNKREDIRRLNEHVDNIFRIVCEWGYPQSYARM